ncbi:MAG: aldehyde dehydrogenase family protein, partial [Myxococcales bacterium]|nr:aldehyde dehydrogenase family protein [Myxococcales bacterium]
MQGRALACGDSQGAALVSCLVGGRWVPPGVDGLQVHDPATGEHIATVPALAEAAVVEAIAAAAAAWPAWRARTAKERSACLRRWHALIERDAEALARLLTREQGKPLAEARGEIAYANGFVDWFSAEALRVYGETVPSPWADGRVLVTREPVGVAALITPWNFPAAMIT